MPVGDLKLVFKPNIDEFAMDSCAIAHNTINIVYEMVKINQYFQMYIETKVIIENNVVDTLCLAKWWLCAQLRYKHPIVDLTSYKTLLMNWRINHLFDRSDFRDRKIHSNFVQLLQIKLLLHYISRCLVD